MYVSLALPRDAPEDSPEVKALHRALLAQLCIRHELTLLTTDRDFEHASPHIDLHLWRP